MSDQNEKVTQALKEVRRVYVDGSSSALRDAVEDLVLLLIDVPTTRVEIDVPEILRMEEGM